MTPKNEEATSLVLLAPTASSYRQPRTFLVDSKTSFKRNSKKKARIKIGIELRKT